MEKKLKRLIDLSLCAKKIYNNLYELETYEHEKNFEEDFNSQVNNLKLLIEMENKIYDSLSVDEIMKFINIVGCSANLEIGDVGYALYFYNEDNESRRVYSKLILKYVENYQEDQYRFNQSIEFYIDTNKINIGDKDIYFYDRYSRLNEIYKFSDCIILMKYLNEMNNDDNIDQKYRLSYINPILEKILLAQNFDDHYVNIDIFDFKKNEVELINYNIHSFSEKYLFEIISSLLNADIENINEESLYFDIMYIKASLMCTPQENRISIYNTIKQFNNINKSELAQYLLELVAEYVDFSKFEKEKTKLK